VRRSESRRNAEISRTFQLSPLEAHVGEPVLDRPDDPGPLLRHHLGGFTNEDSRPRLARASHFSSSAISGAGASR
jgi:hypothetical protein